MWKNLLIYIQILKKIYIIIKEILQLIKNDSKYAKENIANNKINGDIEYITKILEDDKN